MRTIAIACWLLTSCVTVDPKPDPVPPPDGGCADICEHGRQSGCEWADDTEDGEACEQVCGDLDALLPGAFATSLQEDECR